jgi:hypothetical protein
MALLGTRPPDPEADWNFYHDRHPIDPADLAEIRPLDEPSAASLWQELVSADPRQRHPMLLPSGHWVGRLVATFPGWQDAWGQPAGHPDPVAGFLRSQIGWPNAAEVYFIWMRERAVRVPWGVFLRTWRNFLFSNEGPFLVRLQHPEFVFFAPTALMGVGHRPGHHPSSG